MIKVIWDATYRISALIFLLLAILEGYVWHDSARAAFMIGLACFANLNIIVERGEDK
jgi:hypothetical protein